MWSNLLTTEENITQIKKINNLDYEYKSVSSEIVKDYLNDGWEMEKEFKTRTRIRKIKSIDLLFEHRVWMMFYSLGFRVLNKDRNLMIPYSENFDLKQQIDVFAADDETVLIIECKAAQSANTRKDFKKEIESIHGKMDGLRKCIRKEFPNRKVKFIFSTFNYVLNEKDKKRLEEFGIVYFDEEKIEYYTELARHLGKSAKYQLLGDLFKGSKIQGMDNVVPAIYGRMGGFQYYSFSIEPEVLLKLGYVLHRSSSNKDMMPTYQRIIKKSRLNSIQEFVEKGGYFPNSIIVNIETGEKGLRFDAVKHGEQTSNSKMGLLHLPQKYQSIYIIDGQHRLYGYSNSSYRFTNTIPVVAFVNMSQEEQIQLFMDINENQKAVPKNLRNTLEETMNYYSENNVLKRKALAIKIARMLGENTDSALFGRVILGEDKKTDYCCITLESISGAIKKSGFLSEFDRKNSLIYHGLFDKENNDNTFNILFPFIKECINYIVGKTNSDTTGKSIISNPSIYGIIRICADVACYLSGKGLINPLKQSTLDMSSYINKYLDFVVDYWLNMKEDEYNELKSTYGEGAKTKYLRSFQKSINRHDKDFQPEGMKKYWEDNNKENFRDASDLVAKIEDYIKEDIRKGLEDKYLTDWLKLGLSKNLYLELHQRVIQKNYDADTDEYYEPWDCLYLIDYKNILEKNWGLFEEKYTWPGNENKNKKEKLSWFNQLNKIRNTCAHHHKAKSEDLEFLKELSSWLIRGNGQ